MSQKAAKYFLLSYKYVANAVEKRAPFRSAHLQYIQPYVNNGQLLLGGAFADPVDAAAIVFKMESKEDVVKFAASDPYVTSGLVSEHNIREWTVVVGSAFEPGK